MIDTIHRQLETASSAFGNLVGTSWAFLFCLLVCGTWVFLLFHGNSTDSYRVDLVAFVNLFMFVHLFLIQRLQNKNLKALHLKLDELIASKDGANNSLIKAERASEKEINELHEKYVDLAESSSKKGAIAKVGLIDQDNDLASRKKVS